MVGPIGGGGGGSPYTAIKADDVRKKMSANSVKFFKELSDTYHLSKQNEDNMIRIFVKICDECPRNEGLPCKALMRQIAHALHNGGVENVLAKIGDKVGATGDVSMLSDLKKIFSEIQTNNPSLSESMKTVINTLDQHMPKFPPPPTPVTPEIPKLPAQRPPVSLDRSKSPQKTAPSPTEGKAKPDTNVDVKGDKKTQPTPDSGKPTVIDTKPADPKVTFRLELPKNTHVEDSLRHLLLRDRPDTAPKRTKEDLVSAKPLPATPEKHTPTATKTQPPLPTESRQAPLHKEDTPTLLAPRSEHTPTQKDTGMPSTRTATAPSSSPNSPVTTPMDQAVRRTPAPKADMPVTEKPIPTSPDNTAHRTPTPETKASSTPLSTSTPAPSRTASPIETKTTQRIHTTDTPAQTSTPKAEVTTVPKQMSTPHTSPTPSGTHATQEASSAQPTPSPIQAAPTPQPKAPWVKPDTPAPRENTPLPQRPTKTVQSSPTQVSERPTPRQVDTPQKTPFTEKTSQARPSEPTVTTTLRGWKPTLETAVRMHQTPQETPVTDGNTLQASPSQKDTLPSPTESRASTQNTPNPTSERPAPVMSNSLPHTQNTVTRATNPVVIAMPAPDKTTTDNPQKPENTATAAVRPEHQVTETKVEQQRTMAPTQNTAQVQASETSASPLPQRAPSSPPPQIQNHTVSPSLSTPQQAHTPQAPTINTVSGNTQRTLTTAPQPIEHLHHTPIQRASQHPIHIVTPSPTHQVQTKHTTVQTTQTQPQAPNAPTLNTAPSPKRATETPATQSWATRKEDLIDRDNPRTERRLISQTRTDSDSSRESNRMTPSIRDSAPRETQRHSTDSPTATSQGSHSTSSPSQSQQAISTTPTGHVGQTGQLNIPFAVPNGSYLSHFSSTFSSNTVPGRIPQNGNMTFGNLAPQGRTLATLITQLQSMPRAQQLMFLQQLLQGLRESPAQTLSLLRDLAQQSPKLLLAMIKDAGLSTTLSISTIKALLNTPNIIQLLQAAKTDPAALAKLLQTLGLTEQDIAALATLVTQTVGAVLFEDEDKKRKRKLEKHQEKLQSTMLLAKYFEDLGLDAWVTAMYFRAGMQAVAN